MALTAISMPAPGAEDALRIDQLRQDVLELQRAVREQARRLERLEQLLERERREGEAHAPAGETARPAEPPAWLSAAKWQSLKRGMTESEAVAILGAPTALRTGSAGTRILLYSRELPAGGFLSGRIVIEGGRVAEISAPALR